MVANVKQETVEQLKAKFAKLSEHDLAAKTVEKLLEAADALQKLKAENAKLQALVTELKNAYSAADKKRVTVQGDNDQLRVALKEYGRHKNRCEWNHHGACDCGLDDVLKEPDSE